MSKIPSPQECGSSLRKWRKRYKALRSNYNEALDKIAAIERELNRVRIQRAEAWENIKELSNELDD